MHPDRGGTGLAEVPDAHDKLKNLEFRELYNEALVKLRESVGLDNDSEPPSEHAGPPSDQAPPRPKAGNRRPQRSQIRSETPKISEEQRRRQAPGKR